MDKQNQLILKNCNFVKCILMILVVLGHSLDFWTGNWFTKDPVYSAPVLSLVADWLNSFHVQTFTLVSGYIFFFIKYEKNAYAEFISFVNKKVYRLVIPYVFVSCIWVIPIGCFFFHTGIKDIVNKYIFASSPSQLWFLIMLFDVFIIFYFLSDFFKNHNFLSFLLVGVLFFIGLFCGSYLPNMFQIIKALKYVTFFLIGFKLRQYRITRLNTTTTIIFLVGWGLLFFIFVIFNECENGVIALLNVPIEYGLNIVGSLNAFYLLQKLAFLIPYEQNKMFISISKKSMAIFLFHQQIIYLVICLLNGHVNPYLNAFVNFVIALIGSIVISTICFKFKITRFLIGEKD